MKAISLALAIVVCVVGMGAAVTGVAFAEEGEAVAGQPVSFGVDAGSVLPGTSETGVVTALPATGEGGLLGPKTRGGVGPYAVVGFLLSAFGLGLIFRRSRYK